MQILLRRFEKARRPTVVLAVAKPWGNLQGRSLSLSETRLNKVGPIGSGNVKNFVKIYWLISSPRTQRKFHHP